MFKYNEVVMNKEELEKLQKTIASTDKSLYSVGPKILFKRLFVVALLVSGIMAKPLYPTEVQKTMTKTENSMNKMLESVNHSLNKFGADQMDKVNPYLYKVVNDNSSYTIEKNLAVAIISINNDMRLKEKNPNYKIDLENRTTKVHEKVEEDRKIREKEINEIRRDFVFYKTKFELLSRKDPELKKLKNPKSVAEILYYKGISSGTAIQYVKDNPEVIHEKVPTYNQIIGFKIEEKNNKNSTDLTQTIDKAVDTAINKVKSLADLKNKISNQKTNPTLSNNSNKFN